MNNKNKNILISLILIVVSYGLVNAWTNLSTVTNGTALTATVWNDMVTKVNETGNRVSGIFTDGTGKVGIGTQSPTSKFQVVADGTQAGNSMIINGTDNINGLIIQAGGVPGTPISCAGCDPFIVRNSVGTEFFRVGSTGNVGIGTATPTAKLQVAGGNTVLQQEAWIAPTFENSWANYGGPFAPVGYFKDSLGVVHLRGLTNLGTVGACIFTLPVGYRPIYQSIFNVQTNPNVAGRLDINTTGCVFGSTISNGWASLEGITFATH